MIPFEFVIWDSQACAEYLKESRDTFMKKTRYLEGFPKPLPAFEKKNPRWLAQDVIKFATGKPLEITRGYTGTLVTG